MRGSSRSLGASAGNIGRIGFAGREWIPEVNIWHSRARAYAPALGRFLQPDPIGMAGGANLYGYAGNDPMNMIDPMGLLGEGANDCQPLDVKCFDDSSTPRWTGGPLRWQGFGSHGTVIVWGRRNSSDPAEAEREDRLSRDGERLDRAWQSCALHPFTAPVGLPGRSIAGSANPCGGILAEGQGFGDVLEFAIGVAPVGRAASAAAAVGIDAASVTGHIFKQTKGHIIGRTPEIRARYMALFNMVKSDKRDFVQTTRNGVEIYRKNFGPNLQVWVNVHPKGYISSAGVNRGSQRR
jgi:RHS repeat-associated protein